MEYCWGDSDDSQLDTLVPIWQVYVPGPIPAENRDSVLPPLSSQPSCSEYCSSDSDRTHAIGSFSSPIHVHLDADRLWDQALCTFEHFVFSNGETTPPKPSEHVPGFSSTWTTSLSDPHEVQHVSCCGGALQEQVTENHPSYSQRHSCACRQELRYSAHHIPTTPEPFHHSPAMSPSPTDHRGLKRLRSSSTTTPESRSPAYYETRRVVRDFNIPTDECIDGESLADIEAELNEMLMNTTDPVGKFLRKYNLSAHDAIVMGIHETLLDAPKKVREKYGPRRSMSSLQRDNLTRERNREHARATRRRKRIFRELEERLQMMGVTVGR